MAVKPDTNPILAEALKAVRERTDIGPTVQYSDVIVKTAIMFALVVASAVVGWMFLPYNLFTVLGLIVATLVVVFMASRQQYPTAPLPLLYSVLEGLLIGAFSRMMAASYGADIVVTALTATTIVFGVILAVFHIPAVRNSGQGRRFFLVALLSYVAFGLLSLVLGVFFGVGDGYGFYGLGPLSIAISIAGVLFASWSLLVDFGDVDRAVQAGFPEAQSWRLALGLTISTVWLYLEIMRLLAVLRR